MQRFAPFSQFRSLDRQVLFHKIYQQASLQLAHDVNSCLQVRSLSNKWLYNRGLQQGISGALVYLEDSLPTQADKDTPQELSLVLNKLQREMLETCELTPYKAVRRWGLTELEDRLDIEKEDVICGVKHGLQAVTLTLPRLLKTSKVKG
jgi:hypothetical protein